VSELNLHGADQAKGIKLVSDHMGRIAVSLDTMRLMLNTFAMEKVLIPIARKTEGRTVGTTKGEDDTRGSQRDEHEETQAREDADLEMNGHDVLQNGKEPESSKTRDTGRGL